MIPDDVEKIIMTKEDYDRNVEKLLYDKIKAEQENEILHSIIKEVREYIENNNLYEQDYTYDYEENIEEWPPDDTRARKELLEILDKENKDV